VKARPLLAGDRSLLKLDIDKGCERPTLLMLCRRLRRAGYAIKWLSECISPSGKGWHIILDVKPSPVTPQEVVALQAVLGSDPAREACNLARANLLPRMSAYARDRWNVFYK